MLVKYNVGKLYLCKLVACIPGCHNWFEGYNLIVQKIYTKQSSGSVLFTDYKFSTNLVKIDTDCVQGQCFVVESNLQNIFVSLSLDKTELPNCFTKS